MRIFPSSRHDPSAARSLDIEVEPLSEQRWSKIEQGVFARLDSGAPAPSHEFAVFSPSAARRAAPWLVAAAAVVATLSVLAAVLLPTTDATLSRVSTGATASHLALPGIVLDVSPDSAVVVSGNSRESQLIVLDRGQVTCEVEHRRPGAPLIVQAGEVQVEVVGTHFVVTRLGESARVTVQTGVVKVSSRGRTVAVKAGESWPAPHELAATPPPLAPQAPEGVPSDEQVAPRALRPRALRSQTAENRPDEVAPEPEPSELQAQFETAASLEAKSPGRAIQLYQGLENGGSSWAKNALFAHGRLEAARGNKPAARRVLTQYLARFPRGPNAADARLLLTQLE
jgi:hypothetical protein